MCSQSPDPDWIALHAIHSVCANSKERKSFWTSWMRNRVNWQSSFGYIRYVARWCDMWIQVLAISTFWIDIFIRKRMCIYDQRKPTLACSTLFKDDIECITVIAQKNRRTDRWFNRVWVDVHFPKSTSSAFKTNCNDKVLLEKNSSSTSFFG